MRNFLDVTEETDVTLALGLASGVTTSSQPKTEAQIAAERKRNRERMPEIARVVDEFRRVFGPGVKLLWAREGGFEVGVRSKDRAPLEDEA